MKNDLIELVTKLKQEQYKQDLWIDSLPDDISSAFFDNDYVNSICIQRDNLIESIFGVDSDVFWFLYEFTAGKTDGPHIVLKDGTKYSFKTDEDFYKYLKDNA